MPPEAPPITHRYSCVIPPTPVGPEALIPAPCSASSFQHGTARAEFADIVLYDGAQQLRMR